MPFLLTILFFSAGPSKIYSQVAAWGDGDITWSSSTLNDARSDYFQGEVIPFVYKTTPLLNGGIYTFNIVYDYYNNSGNKNAGGYAFITTYNTSRNPPAFTGGSAPAIDNSFTGTGNTGVFYVENADVTATTAPSGTDTKTVSVTFTYTGADGGNAYIYWGMYLSKTGTVPDQGNGSPTNGAGHWPGGSLALTITGDGGGGNVGNNPGSGGVVDGIISGMKYSDLDKSGGKNGSEPGLQGWTIYIDNDVSGDLSAGDISTTTDADGNYSFHDLLPRVNPYIVREVNQAGWTQTQPGSLASYQYSLNITAAAPVVANNLFGNFTCATPKPTITPSTATICAGGSATLTSSSATGNQWYNNGVIIPGATNNTYDATGVGPYTVTVTLLDCPATSDPVTITVNQPSVAPTGATASVSPICNGGSSIVTPTGGTLGTGASYKWYTDAGFTIPAPGTPNATTGALTVSPITTTTYYVRIEGTSSPCSGTTTGASVQVVVNQPSVAPTGATASVSPICNGGSSIVTPTGGTLGTGASYKWYTDAGFTTPAPGTPNATTGALTVSPITTTTYYVRIEGTSSPCSGTTTGASVQVVVNQPSVAPTGATASVSPICNGGSSIVTPTGGTLGTGASYKWYTDAGFTIPAPGTPNATTGALTVSPITTTTYYVRIEGTSSPCSGTTTGASVQVVVNQPITFTPLINQTVNYGDASATFSVAPTTNVVSYQWQQKTTVSGSIFSTISGSTSSLTINNPTVALNGYQYKVNMTAISPCADQSSTATLYVTPAVACAVYNGDYFVNTSDPNGGSATIHLSVTITKTPLNAPGNITSATLLFTLAEVGGGTTTAIGNLSSSTATTATFTKDTIIALSSTKLSKTFDVSWVIGGNYTNDANCENSTEVTVSAPANDFVTGGGYIVPVNSAGTKGGANTNGLKNNLGFNVKWNKNFTNLQGSFNTIIRKKEPTDGNKIHTYQVKSNKPTGLIVYQKTTTSPARAIITYGNATLKDVTYIVNGICTSTPANCFNDGGAIVTFEVVDFGLPSGTNNKEDSVSILVKDKVNGLWYSSNVYNAATNRTKLDSLTRGNIDIHTGGAKSSARLATGNQLDATVAATELNLSALPNPTTHSFNLQLQGSNQKMQVRVMDLLGRTVETIPNLSAGQMVQIGGAYKPGIYVIELVQGTNKKQLKLVKI